MAEEEAKVRIRLVVDDQSAETLSRVKSGMADVAAESKKAAEDVQKLGVATHDLGGGGIEKAAHGIEQMGQHAHGTAGHTDEARKSAEGLAGEVLKGNIYFEIMKKSADLVAEGVKQAWELTEKLTEAALEAAEAEEKQEKEMAGFLFLMDQGKHSMGELRAYTGDMREEFAKFGAESGVATEDLVEGFDKLVERGTMGSEKAKELTEQMAVVGRVVPGGMASLTQGMSQMEMGMVRPRNAIVQLISVTQTLHGNAKAVAEQMKHMTPEAQMALGEKAIAKQAEALKKMGALVPDLGQLKTSFADIKESALEGMGKPMMDALIPELVKLRDFLLKHMDEIVAFGRHLGEAAADVIGYISSMVQGIYEGIMFNWDDFKKTFHDIFGDWEAAWNVAKRDTAGIKNEFSDIGIALKGIFTAIAYIVKGMVNMMLDANDAIHLRMPGSTRAGFAADEVKEKALTPGEDKDFKKAMDEYTMKALQAGKSAEEINKVVADATATHNNVANAAQQDKSDVLNQNWEAVNKALQYNVDNHQDALRDYQIGLLAQSEEGRKAIESGAVTIAGGMDAMIKILQDKAPDVAKALREAGNVVKTQGGIKPAAGITFNGANFHIKQDFRDQDPDRIALVFKKELSSAAVSRTMARTATPFGL